MTGLYGPPSSGTLPTFTAGSTLYANASGALAANVSVVNVMGKGALGDGVTDDSAAFIAAIAACPVGGTLYVPPGSYILNSTITIAKQISVVGAGVGQTLLYCNPSGDGIVWGGGGAIGARIFNVLLADVHILFKSDQAATFAAIRVDNIGYGQMRSVFVSNAGGGKPQRCLQVDYAADIRFEMCRFTGAAGDNVFLGPKDDNTQVVEMLFDGATEVNSSFGGNGVTIQNTHAGTSSVEGIHFENTTLYLNTGHAAYINATGTGFVRNIHFHATDFDSSHKGGIYAETSGSGRIDTVTVNNCWTSFNGHPSFSPTQAWDGIYFGPGCYNVTVRGGEQQLSGGHGVHMDGVINPMVALSKNSNNGQYAGSGGISTYYGIAFTGTCDGAVAYANMAYQDQSPARASDTYKQNGIFAATTCTNPITEGNDTAYIGSGAVRLNVPINYNGAATRWFEAANRVSTTTHRGYRTSGSTLFGAMDKSSIYRLHTVGGQVRFEAIATAVISAVTNVGTAGATSYWYWVMASDGQASNQNNALVSASVSTTTGNATLDGTNYNTVSWGRVDGAARYYVYRTTTGTFAAANCIAIVNATTGDAATLTLNDQGGGFVLTLSPPGRNSTADVFGDGYISPTIQGAGMSSTAVATATAGTIAVSPTVSRVKPTGAITGVILATPSTVPASNAPYVTVVNESAFSVTFDVVGTSHVANGVSCVIAALTAKHFVYDTAASTPAWYPTS